MNAFTLSKMSLLSLALTSGLASAQGEGKPPMLLN
jgi:hypothetical protein